VTDVLGLIGLALFIVCIIGLAAALTWLVVEIPEVWRRRRTVPARD
jgi:hypothetical protein